VALAVFAASPASAENQQVQVTDNTFTLPGVAVKPGESVTWTHPPTADRHNVRFEDDTDGRSRIPGPPDPNPWTGSRTFSTEGTFRYYCEEHGSPGGGGMAGIVYVNSTGTVAGVAPMASFTVSPTTARVNENIVFNATGTSDSDPDDSIIRHEWDFDGNGSYEIDTGTTKSTSQSYATAGTRTVKLRVTDEQMNISETTRSFTVTNAPIASFTSSPTPAQTGQTVNFDGSASSDADGTIAKYEWDLDGNGDFETDTGTTATTSRSYTTAGTLTIRLRVTDNLGVPSETTRSLQVNAPTPPPPDQPPADPPQSTPGGGGTSPAPPAPGGGGGDAGAQVRMVLPNMVRPGGSARQSGGKIVVSIQGRLIGAQGRSCRGRVEVGVRVARNSRVTRVTRMGSNCRYSARVSVPLRRVPRSLRPRRKTLVLRVAARFQGNAGLRTDLSPTKRMKVRR